MPANSMTAHAACNGEPARGNPFAVDEDTGRPPVVKWSLLFLSCVTASDYTKDKLQRLRYLASESLNDSQMRVCEQTALRCMREIRDGATAFEAAS